jgi:hypothetical protein
MAGTKPTTDAKAAAAQNNEAPAPEQKTPETGETKKAFSTKLTRLNDSLMPLIESQLEGHGINMTEYQKQCVLMGISAINAMLDKEGLFLGSKDLDDRNFTEMLIRLASLQLNASASPREVYFQIRKQKVKNPDGSEDWKKQIEMGIEGDGNDSILRRFGADVEKVARFWLVRSEDEFVYPKHKGFEMTPPEWTETGRGDVVRVVYPILTKSGAVEYYISERDDVKRNLAAHINNNLMNETFGICKSRYDATEDQKKQIAAKKKEVLAKVDKRPLDEIIDDPDLQSWISPSWTDPHSRESMIIRKMRNNVVKKIPKDFSSAYVASSYLALTDDVPSAVESEIAGAANKTVVDVDYTSVDPGTGEIVDQPAGTAPAETPPAGTRPNPF